MNFNSIKMNFSESLKYYRLLIGLTQKQLASVLETNNTNVSNWEKGISKPDIEMLVRISNIFGIPIDELIFFEKKINNFSVQKLSPKTQSKNSVQRDENSVQKPHPKQYDPNDGKTHDFDSKQIEVLNGSIAAQDKVIAMKNELLAAKDELLAAKDQTITVQKEALKLLEGQINASTALMEKFTIYINNEPKKRPTNVNVSTASDVAAKE